MSVKHYAPAKPGTNLVGFNVLAEIGRGAASIIYLVQDPKTKQIWALKHVEREDAKDQRFLDQATREYEIAQKVKCPLIRHIDRVIKSRTRLVQIKDLYLLMEYVDGVSVELHPPTSMDAALSIFIQTAEGLAHMHRCGYVHADMKPNNIVVDPGGHVKIIDLGQACPIGTVKERIQGTPEYIAPEQVHRREITPKTDIYNLGATMYWTLTGRHIPTAMPKGDSLMGSLDDEFIQKATPAHEVNTGIPVALSELISHCIEVNPDNRPVAMLDVKKRLEEIRSALNKPAEAAAQPPSTAESA